jgi:hypothetical protein
MGEWLRITGFVPLQTHGWAFYATEIPTVIRTFRPDTARVDSTLLRAR